MTNRELALGVDPQGWRAFMARKQDPAFQPFAKKVFSRDKYSCQFCGFQARDYQEVINVDGNYQSNSLKNMATACCFCSQCCFVESAGLAGYGGGTLIYLPEISQIDLNAFCHVIFCAISNDTGYRETAQATYRSLKYRAQVVENEFGEGSSDPVKFGQLYLDSGMNNPETLAKALQDLRLLPSRAKFRAQIEKWAEAALQEMAESHFD